MLPTVTLAKELSVLVRMIALLRLGEFCAGTLVNGTFASAALITTEII